MSHTWTFFRAGGFDQVKLASGADLANLDQLDQKLWVALACPTTGVEFDTRTLAFIDTDKDGRVRAPELIAAAKWATGVLKNPDALLNSSDTLALADINDETPEGRQLLASAKHILTSLGRGEAAEITLADTLDTEKIFGLMSFNGDGIVPAETADNDATKAVIADIITCFGPAPDRSGKPGVSQAMVDQFFADAQAYSDWRLKAETDKAILPLGEATFAAADAVKAVKVKVDDFFARCRLAAYDPRALPTLNRDEKEYLALTAKDISSNAAEITGFPLALVAAGKALPLVDSVNPAWAAALAALRSAAVKPLLGDKSSLTEADWTTLQDKLAAFGAWNAVKAGAGVEKLELKRVREILAGKSKDSLTTLIVKDKSLEPEANAISSVEQLVRYHRDLYTLCVNFVSFKNFYSRTTPAIFQAGRLYLDQRSCDLCLTVADTARHAAMAGLAGAYLAYCDCVRKTTGEKLSIVAIFSQGDDDNLMVGRNGVFYDRTGRDYDATITKIVSNPISLRQAFWLPYKKLARLIEEQVVKRAAAADDVNANLTAASATATAGTPAAPAAAAAPAKPAFDPSVIALISVALGSLAAAGAGVAAFLGKFKSWELPLVVIGIMLIISAPSTLMAFVNLRKRNLGPILDANGWAVNAKAKINVPFGTSLTGIAKLPPGAAVDVSDRYAEKSALWPKFALVIFLVWWAHAYLYSEGGFYSLTDGRYGLKSEAQIQHDADIKAKADLEATKKANATGNPAATATNVIATTTTTASTNAPAIK